MRITAGQWRGRKLEAPEGTDVRPTSDMVRQAIFNILQNYGHPQDSFVLDAFCGTGALGLEALSRDAAHCFFMDIDKKSLSFTERMSRTPAPNTRSSSTPTRRTRRRLPT